MAALDNEVSTSEAKDSEISCEEDEDDDLDEKPEKEEKKRKRGIIYLSAIPRGMNVTKAREIFSVHGTVGRIFLQPGKPKQSNNTTKKPKLAKYFTEGWIEFESKRVAKHVATTLNNNMIGGRKKSKFYDQTWNIKYLPRFKWVHLSERLAYEQATRRQRMRAEIFQAKRESNYFSHNLDVSEKLRRMEKRKNKTTETSNTESVLVLPRQRQNEESAKLDRNTLSVASDSKKIKKSKTKVNGKNSAESRGKFLTNLFGT